MPDRRLEDVDAAADVDLHRARDVALRGCGDHGGEVHDAGHAVLLDRAAQEVAVADVPHDDADPLPEVLAEDVLCVLDVGERLGLARAPAEEAEDHHVVALIEEVSDDVGPDEADAGDENGHGGDLLSRGRVGRGPSGPRVQTNASLGWGCWGSPMASKANSLRASSG